MIPRGTDLPLPLRHARSAGSTFYTPGEIETPNRYRNRYGQLLEHAPFSQRDFTPPASSRPIDERGESRPQGPRPPRLPGLRARLPPVRRRRLGRLRLPLHVQHPGLRAARPAACTSRRRRTRRSRARTSSSARSARGCSTGTTQAIVLPYHHSNVQSEEVMYYVDGHYGAAQGRRRRLHHAASLRPPARPAARAGREGDRREGDERAGGDVRHVPAAEADDALRATSTYPSGYAARAGTERGARAARA